MMRLVTVVLLAALLAACESLPPVAVVADPRQNLETHTHKIEQLASWTLEGRISLRYEEEAWHAGLFWHQVGDIFQVRLLAPFGQGGAQLDGSSHGVVLNNGEGEFRADSADRLLAEQFGWQIPVEGLRYWTTGRAAPGSEYNVVFDENGQLAELQQGDWQVEYRGYRQVEPLVLPAKVFLKHRSGLDVRVVVDNWKIQSEQAATQ